MSWQSIKSSLPFGVAGGVIAAGGFIGLDSANFNIFNLTQLGKLLSVAVGGFLISFGFHLRGLNTSLPWDEKTERRRDGDTKKEDIP